MTLPWGKGFERYDPSTQAGGGSWAAPAGRGDGGDSYILGVKTSVGQHFGEVKTGGVFRGQPAWLLQHPGDCLGQSDTIVALAFSPGGRTLASGGTRERSACGTSGPARSSSSWTTSSKT
jgi:hypothetical protein